VELSERIEFNEVAWSDVPAEPGVYVIYDLDEVVYVGMAGRNGKGSLRNRLRDHASGQIVNMFAQYLFLARVQFIPSERITHPRDAKMACREYIRERCSFQYLVATDGAEARDLENRLKDDLKPTLNP
jgi:excinuclease UvrABC nuclease subunit